MQTHSTHIALAFLAVVLIWSTTPLAIAWSAEQTPITSASIRMLIGLAFCYTVVRLRGQSVPFSHEYMTIYLISGLSIYGAMCFFYLSSLHIPSGWIAVISGLSPLLTGVFAAFIEPEARLTLKRFIGLTFGLFGLYWVFAAGMSIQQASLKGIIYVLSAVAITSVTAVIMRQLIKSANVSGMQMTTGSLIVALPFLSSRHYYLNQAPSSCHNALG